MADNKTSSFANAKSFIKDAKKPLIAIGGIIAVSMAYSLTAHHTSTVNKASVLNAPNTTSRAGDPVSQSYQHDIDVADKKRLENANKTGDSFMETLTPHSGNEHSLMPNLDDSNETGAGEDKGLPDLPDAQPHIALPPPPPPAGQRSAENTPHKQPMRYVSKERIAELQRLLAARINNDSASQDIIFDPVKSKTDTSGTQVASMGQSGIGSQGGYGSQSGYRSQGNSGEGYGGGDGRSTSMTGGSDASLRAVAARGAGAGDDSSGISFEVPDPGTVLPAHFLSLTDSRIPGMVLAVIDDGPYRGSRAIGKFSVATGANKLMFQFTKLIIPYEDDSGEKRAKVLGINAVAVNPDTLSEGMSTYVNTHMLPRIASVMATSFMQGLGEAIQQSGSTAAYTASGGTIVSQGEKSLTQEMFQAGGQSASQISGLLNQMFGNMPTTIKEAQYVSFGMLFVGDKT